MRVHILNTLAGALGLAALVASAPALSYGSDLEPCGSSITTVYVTVPASSSIAVSELSTTTVYLAVPASSTVEVSGVIVQPTSTLTLHSTQPTTTTSPQVNAVYTSSPLYTTIYITGFGYTMTTVVQLTQASPDTGITAISTLSPPSYDVAVTETAVVPAGLTSSGGGSTATIRSASNGIISYTVENGTTYWLNGQTPASSESYVTETSAITVVPVYQTTSRSQGTSTVTLHSTVFETQQLTLTETLQTSTSTAAGVSTSPSIAITETLQTSTSTAAGVPTAPSIGTGLIYTGIASGGWNASSTAGGVTTSSPSPSMTISTVYMTSIYTITSCVPTITNCPARIGSVTTEIISLYTTVCPDSANNAAVTASTVAYESISLKTTYPSFDIYQSSHSTISLSSLAAESGFNAITTSSAAASTAAGASINGSSTPTPSRSASSSSLQYVLSSAAASTAAGASVNRSSAPARTMSTSSTPVSYAPSSVGSALTNSTSAASSATSSASGVSTSSNSLPALLSSIAAELNSTSATSTQSSATSYASGVSTSSNSLPGLLSSVAAEINSTSATLTASTAASSSLGVVNSLTSGSSLVGYSFSSAASTTLKTSISSLAAVTSSTTLASYQVSTSSSSASNSATSAGVLTSSKPSSSSPTTSSYVATSISSSASATPSSCGEYGNFTLTFDDIPPLSISNGTDPNTVQPEPVFNPYHQFDFSDGWTVVPPPTDPYLPSSKPLLLEFIPNFNVNGTNQQAGPNTAEGGYSGQISDGDGGTTGCFAFNMYGANFGCDSRGPDCDFTFTGYREDPLTHVITQVAFQGHSIPACPALSDCSLLPITLDNTFQNLVYVRINVTVQLQPKIWWMDDLRLGWFDNSCTTGLCRQNAHVP